MKEVSFKNDVLPLKDKLFRMALHITSNREEAEDIVQDTLMKLWNQRDEWSAIQNIEKPDNSQIQDETLIRQQQMDSIQAIIQQLPEKQRTIILLRDIEEKTYQEIANIMGLSLSDVKVNLFRARQTLKNKFNKS